MFIYVLVVSVAGSIISIARIVTANNQALSQLVWAEDGLFPLCVKQSGYLECLIDPFAGYFLFLSRTLAIPVSWFPVEMWPLATNLVAAVGAGLLAGGIAWTLATAGVGRLAAGAASLMSVLVPIVGLEAVNTAGSLYMPLLVWAALLASLPPKSTAHLALVVTVLLVTSLTIPSSIVLLLPLSVSAYLWRPSLLRFLLGTFALIMGFLVQVITTMTTANPRPVALSVDSAVAWFEGLASALWTLTPVPWGLDPTGVIDAANSNATLDVALQVVLVLLVLASLVVVWQGARSSQPVVAGLGMLVFTGVLLSGVPALLGYPNNRYFVIPIVAVCVAGVSLLDRLSTRWGTTLAIAVSIAAVAMWIPRFPASDFRATARPPWTQMLEDAQAQCRAGAEQVSLTFSPDWPFSDAVFPGVTKPLVMCDRLANSA